MSTRRFLHSGVATHLSSSHSSPSGKAVALVFAMRRAAVKNRGSFIEDDDDVFRFRNAEASNVRRTHPGVPLGSSQVERDERKMSQQQLVEEDKMTDWKSFYILATVVTLVYTVLQWIVDTGEPYQPTVYEPYVPKKEDL
jgi:hypothetical protein